MAARYSVQILIEVFYHREASLDMVRFEEASIRVAERRCRQSEPIGLKLVLQVAIYISTVDRGVLIPSLL